MPSKKKENRINKISDYLSATILQLNNIHIEAADFEAQLLVMGVLNCDRPYLLAHLDQEINAKDLNTLNKLLKKRLSGWSLAVLFSSKNFYKTSLFVNKDVLVPRPETEVMVENILSEIKDGDIVFDIGTGSGAIIISLALEKKDTNTFYASDKSLAALIVARHNILKHQLNIKLLAGDLLKPYFDILEQAQSSKVIIAANLPYLTPAQMKEPSIKKEPIKALLSGAKGLWHYQRLFTQLSLFLKTTPFKGAISIYCEINPEQKNDIKNLILKYFPNNLISFQKDLCKNIRFCHLSIEGRANHQ